METDSRTRDELVASRVSPWRFSTFRKGSNEFLRFRKGRVLWNRNLPAVLRSTIRVSEVQEDNRRFDTCGVGMSWRWRSKKRTSDPILSEQDLFLRLESSHGIRNPFERMVGAFSIHTKRTSLFLFKKSGIETFPFDALLRRCGTVVRVGFWNDACLMPLVQIRKGGMKSRIQDQSSFRYRSQSDSTSESIWTFDLCSGMERIRSIFPVQTKKTLPFHSISNRIRFLCYTKKNFR